MVYHHQHHTQAAQFVQQGDARLFHGRHQLFLHLIRFGDVEQTGAEIGHKNTKLRRRTQQETLGIGKHRTKIRHRADTKENQRGVNSCFDTDVKIQYSVRSSVESAKAALMEKLEIIFDLCGADMKVSGEYPGWAYKVDSPLRDKMVRVYEEVFGIEKEAFLPFGMARLDDFLDKNRIEKFKS